MEEAAQAALEASSAAEAQHAAAAKQLAADKRNLQEQRDQASSCMTDLHTGQEHLHDGVLHTCVVLTDS